MKNLYQSCIKMFSLNGFDCRRSDNCQGQVSKGFRAYTRGTVAFISENVKLQQKVLLNFNE